jgi:quercetin dioxygenase-like cupin family protein
MVTGTGPDGRSCVVGEAEIPPGADPVAVHSLYKTGSRPSPRPSGHADTRDLGVAPGAAEWLVVDWAPNTEAPMHHTDTLDFDLVVEGSIEVILDDGPHLLEAGDCVVITGVDHAWRAGPAGCRLSVALVGTPPPARG